MTRTAKWHRQAEENLAEWGLQPTDELLLALQEELGELTQAYLEAEYEDGNPDEIQRELDDLMALGIQLDIRLSEDHG